jgi:hypothetical protein
MGLETGTYVSDLNTSNPVNGDPVSQGAAHIRLIKTVLQATFPDADAPIYGLRAETAKSLTGSSVDFAGIPSWVKRITLTVNGLSTNGSSLILVRMGTASGFETSGYSGSSVQFTYPSGAVSVDTTSTAFALMVSANASSSVNAVMTLVRHSGNEWVMQTTTSFASGTTAVTGGTKTLGGALTQVRVLTTDTFDAGTANILYE